MAASMVSMELGVHGCFDNGGGFEVKPVEKLKVGDVYQSKSLEMSAK